MEKKAGLILGLLFLLGACAASPEGARDLHADKKLQVESEEALDADESLFALTEKAEEQRQRDLERQINESLTETSPQG